MLTNIMINRSYSIGSTSQLRSIIVVFLQCTMKEKLLLVLINTLLLHTPLLALTDRQNDGRRDEYNRCAWAGGTFFPVVLLCQSFVLAGNRFWVYILTYVT